MFYPAILTVIALLVTVACHANVVPRWFQVFAGHEPATAVVDPRLIATSDALRTWGLFDAAVVVGGVFAFKQMLKKPGVSLMPGMPGCYAYLCWAD